MSTVANSPPLANRLTPSGAVILDRAARLSMAQQLHTQLKATGLAACWPGAVAWGLGECVGPDVGFEHQRTSNVIGSVLSPHSSPSQSLALKKPSVEALLSQPTFKHSEQFSKHGPDRWLLRHDLKAKKQLIMAIFSGVQTKGLTYVGIIGVQSDTRMTVNVSTARAGGAMYEGSGRNVELPPGKSQLVAVAHTFKSAHSSMKLQLEVKKCAASTANITLHTCILLPHACDVVTDTDANTALLPRANLLFREQKYAESIPLYLAAAQRLGLSFPEFNARLALQQLGATDQAENIFQTPSSSDSAHVSG